MIGCLILYQYRKSLVYALFESITGIYIFMKLNESTPMNPNLCSAIRLSVCVSVCDYCLCDILRTGHWMFVGFLHHCNQQANWFWTDFQCLFFKSRFGVFEAFILSRFSVVFGVEPDLTREGGSIPVTLTFQEATGRNVMLLPIGSSDDGAHSQNEKLNRYLWHTLSQYPARAVVWCDGSLDAINVQ